MTEENEEGEAAPGQDWDNGQGGEAGKESYNQWFERSRYELRDKDLVEHPERWRMMAHALSEFNPIKKNKFLERPKATLHPTELHSFNCACVNSQQKETFGRRQTKSHQSIDCGQLCLNRSVNQDCLPQVCPVGKACRNRRLTLNQNLWVYPVKTEKKGWGLAAGEFIPKDTFLMQYYGEVFHVDSEIGQARQEVYKNSTCTYMMRTENGEIIDPTYYGNIARFINHSCDPNCVTRKWTVQKETAIGIFSKKDIQEDEELSFDYQFDSFKTPFQKCYCGSFNCKGYLGLSCYMDEDQNDKINAPICTVCGELVVEQDQLLICKGTCKAVFHLDCAAIRDKSVVADNFKKTKYVCKMCFYLKTGKKKPGRKSKQELALLEDRQKGKEAESQPKTVDKPIEYDTEALKFKRDTTDNVIVDKTIRREIEQIDAKSKDNYYNFFVELQKKLKKRMRENRRRFRFKQDQLAKETKEAEKPKRLYVRKQSVVSKDSDEVMAVEDVESIEEEIAYSELDDSSEEEEEIVEQQQELKESEEEVDSVEEDDEENSSSSSLVEEHVPTPQSNHQELSAIEKQQSAEVIPVMSAEVPVEEVPLSLEQIKASVAQRFEDFLQSEPSTDDDVKVRTTHLNVYESVFNIVVVENIDLIECLPGVKLYWETPWAHVVTLRLIAKKEHFRVFLHLFQDTLNKMHQNDFLLVPVLPYHLKGHQELGSDPIMVLPFMIMTMEVPKNLIRRLVGYREGTLTALRARLKVKFNYDTKWFTDYVFPMDDTMPIYVYGWGSDVLDACHSLQVDLEKLGMMTQAVSKEEIEFYLNNIKVVKTWCDPCEIRVKKFFPLQKEKADIRHSFFYMPITTGEIILIGTKEEIDQSQIKLRELLIYQKYPNLNRTTNCFLVPVTLKNQMREVKEAAFKGEPRISFNYYEPIYPRKHYTLVVGGTWDQILLAKQAIADCVTKRFAVLKPSCYSTFEEFQTYAFHKQLRFNLKILKRTELEGTPRYLTFWDTCSHVIEYLDRDLLQINTDQPTEGTTKAMSEMIAPKQPQKQQLSMLEQLASGIDVASEVPREKPEILQQRMMNKQMLTEQDRISIQCQQLKHKELEKYLKVFDTETCVNALYVLSQGACSSKQELPNKFAKQISRNASEVVNDEEQLEDMQQVAKQRDEGRRTAVSLQDIMTNLTLDKMTTLNMVLQLIKKTLNDLNFPYHQIYLYNKQKQKEKHINQIHQRINSALQNLDHTKAQYHSTQERLLYQQDKSNRQKSFKSQYMNQREQHFYSHSSYYEESAPKQMTKMKSMHEKRVPKILDEKQPEVSPVLMKANLDWNMLPSRFSANPDKDKNSPPALMDNEGKAEQDLQLSKSRSLDAPTPKPIGEKMRDPLEFVPKMRQIVTNPTSPPPEYSPSENMKAPASKHQDNYRKSYYAPSEASSYRQKTQSGYVRNRSRSRDQYYDQQSSQYFYNQSERGWDATSSHKSKRFPSPKKEIKQELSVPLTIFQNQSDKKWHACDPGQPSAPPSSCAATNIVRNEGEKQESQQTELIIVTRDGTEKPVRESPERKPEQEDKEQKELQSSTEKMRPPAVRPPPKAPLVEQKKLAPYQKKSYPPKHQHPSFKAKYQKRSSDYHPQKYSSSKHHHHNSSSKSYQHHSHYKNSSSYYPKSQSNKVYQKPKTSPKMAPSPKKSTDSPKKPEKPKQ